MRRREGGHCVWEISRGDGHAHTVLIDLWETLSLPGRLQSHLFWQWEGVSLKDATNLNLTNQFRRMHRGTSLKVELKSGGRIGTTMRIMQPKSVTNVRRIKHLRIQEQQGLRSWSAYRGGRFFFLKVTGSSCTFLKPKEEAHTKTTTHKKHTPGIPLYSRRQIVILIVAIWRKWQYTGLNCDIAYTHCRVREVAFRLGKKTNNTTSL